MTPNNMKNKQGYYGIGIYNGKTISNLGTLWRSAHLFDASFIFTIGDRYKKQPSDTTKAPRHVPLYHYESLEDFDKHVPKDCEIVCIEQTDKTKGLKGLVHPKQCIYLLGAEDSGIPKEYIYGKQVIEIESNNITSLNVAVAGSIILYDRYSKCI